MKKAFLLIDIQNDYFPGGTKELTGVDEASMKAAAVLDAFREANWQVIHVQHLATRPDATFFLPHTTGAAIHPNVAPRAGEKVITKHYPNSFRETELLDYLHANSISHLVIAGMMTHMCVDATTRAAKDFGFTCEVIGDACATKDLEINGELVKAAEVQMSFLAALSYFYATVTTADKYLDAASYA